MPSGAYAACAVGLHARLAGANGRVLFATAAGAVASAVTGNATAGRAWAFAANACIIVSQLLTW